MNAQTKAKEKYNRKSYDQVYMQFPKGTKQLLEELLEEKIGTKYSSKTAYIFEAICNQYQQDTGKSLPEEIMKYRKNIQNKL